MMIWFLLLMKTATIELPDAVFSKFEREAALQQQPLAGYLVGLLVRQTGLVQPTKAAGKEPELPLIPSRTPGSAHITNDMLAELEIADDVEHYERVARR